MVELILEVMADRLEAFIAELFIYHLSASPERNPSSDVLRQGLLHSALSYRLESYKNPLKSGKLLLGWHRAAWPEVMVNVYRAWGCTSQELSVRR